MVRGIATLWIVLSMVAVTASAQVAVTGVEDKEQTALAQSRDPELARNKRIVLDSWRAAQAKRQPAQTFGQHLVNIVAEGDLVLLQTLNVVADPNDSTVSYQNVDHDMFRLREAKIVEHWASPRIRAEQVFAALKAPPRAALPSLPGGALDDAVPINEQQSLLKSKDSLLARNKRAAFDMWRVVLEAGRLDRAEQYMDDGYIQHNAALPSGRQALVESLKAFIKPRQVPPGIEGLKFLIAERDFVVLMQRRKQDGEDATMFDVFRVKDGKVAEHWDSARTANEVAVKRQGQPGIRPLFPPPGAGT